MELRQAKKQELEMIYDLVQKTIQEIYPKYYLKEIVDMFCNHHSKENIAKDIEEGNTYILSVDGKNVGTGTKVENHITRVYVLPVFQKRGYGTFIMNSLEDMIKEKYDFADIDASLPACILYSHLGYQTTDHGIGECENGIIQVYEIMKKQFPCERAEHLRFRPYLPEDADTIVTWIKDEEALRKWSADRYHAYPITANDMNQKYAEAGKYFFPMSMETPDGPVGHLVLRFLDDACTIIRFGFVIVDDSKRGKGYGKYLLQMAIRYAFDMLGAKKITLGVFDNNPSAYYCYKAAGFTEIKTEQEEFFEIAGEKWKCIEMEIKE